MQEATSEATIKEGAYKLLAALFKVLASPARLKILDLLCHNPPESRTFSSIMFSVGKNPNVVSRHLDKLQAYDLVEKTTDGSYRITDIGKLALNATSKDILEIVEKALEIDKAQGKGG